MADGAPPEVLDRLEREVEAELPIATRVREVTLVYRVGGRWHDADRIPLGAG